MLEPRGVNVRKLKSKPLICSMLGWSFLYWYVISGEYLHTMCVRNFPYMILFLVAAVFLARELCVICNTRFKPSAWTTWVHRAKNILSDFIHTHSVGSTRSFRSKWIQQQTNIVVPLLNT